ncbi:MAG: hypothetical protein AAFS03_11340 [Pseudomonadota bacterium]
MSGFTDHPIEVMNFKVDRIASLQGKVYPQPPAEDHEANQYWRVKPIFETDEELRFADFKLHRTERVPPVLVQIAFCSLDQMLERGEGERKAFVIPQRRMESHSTVVRREPVELWDLNRLIDQTAPFQDLAAQLAELVRALRIAAERPPDGSPEMPGDILPMRRRGT